MLIRTNNSLANYNPFREIENLERSFFSDALGFRFGGASDMRTDITDEGDKYVMSVDMPGFDKEDIHVDIEGEYLTVSAEKHSDYEDKDGQGKYLRCERSYGSYKRSFGIKGIEKEGINAQYKNGVLTLELPKEEEKAPESRRLEIR